MQVLKATCEATCTIVANHASLAQRVRPAPARKLHMGARALRRGSHPAPHTCFTTPFVMPPPYPLLQMVEIVMPALLHLAHHTSSEVYRQPAREAAIFILGLAPSTDSLSIVLGEGGVGDLKFEHTRVAALLCLQQLIVSLDETLEPPMRAGVVAAVAGALTDGKEPVRSQAYVTLDLLHENSCGDEVWANLRSTMTDTKFKRLEKAVNEARARRE